MPTLEIQLLVGGNVVESKRRQAERNWGLPTQFDNATTEDVIPLLF